MKFSGCNYWVNQGKNEFEPIGTATSMHDCEGCERLDFCLVSKDSDVWEFNETVKQEMDSNWKLTLKKCLN